MVEPTADQKFLLACFVVLCLALLFCWSSVTNSRCNTGCRRVQRPTSCRRAPVYFKKSEGLKTEVEQDKGLNEVDTPLPERMPSAPGLSTDLVATRWLSRFDSHMPSKIGGYNSYSRSSNPGVHGKEGVIAGDIVTPVKTTTYIPKTFYGEPISTSIAQLQYTEPDTYNRVPIGTADTPLYYSL
jgi:hypothetical protein